MMDESQQRVTEMCVPRLWSGKTELNKFGRDIATQRHGLYSEW